MDDTQAIHNLIFGYAERIDAGDFDGVAELFRDATIRTDGSDQETRGFEAVRQMYVGTTRRYPDTGTPKTKHVTSNVIVEFDGPDRARTRSYYMVFQQTQALPLQPIISGRYHDEFVREDGAWRFLARKIFCDQFGDLTQHLLFDTSRLPGNG